MDRFRRTRILFLSLTAFSILLSGGAFAETPKKKSGGSSASAVVITDGAQIYDKPDFDANILGTVSAGKAVRVSKKKTGNMVKFYKVRAGKLLGYIADIDVKVEGVQPERPKRESSLKRSSKSNRKKPERPNEPLYFSRFIGVSLGTIVFKEGVSGIDAKEGLLTYGLRVTGPDVLLEGAVVDWSLVLHYGAPSYYDRLSTTKPAGFVLWTDALFLLPLNAKQNSMIYFGLGPLLMFSDFKVTNGGQARDLSEINVGISTAFGAALRMDKTVVRLEGKYYIEKRVYPGLQLSLQTPL